MTAHDEDPRSGPRGLTRPEFEHLLHETRASLAALRDGSAAVGGPGDGSDRTGTGQALDGLVQVTAAADGTVSQVDLDPRVMRLPAQDVAEAFRHATNTALADLAARRTEDTGRADAPDVDLTRLHQRIDEIQDQGLRQMDLIAETVSRVMTEMRSR